MAGNEVLIVVRAKDDATKVFRGVADEATKAKGPLGGLAGALGDVGKVAAGVLTANVFSAGFSAFKSGIGDSISLASSFNESLSKTRVVFGEQSGAVEAFASNAAKNLGMAKGAALEATSTFGNFLQAMGAGVPEAKDMSMAMVTLASDLASFNNANPEDVLLALRSGLSGEAEPMRRFGVALSEAAVKEKAAEMGIAALGAELTEQQKIQARYAIIMEQTAMAQGDFERTSDGAANKERILSARMDDAKTRFGQALLPVKMFVMEGLLKMIDNLPKVERAITDVLGPTDQWKAKAQELAAQFRTDVLPVLKDIGTFIKNDVLPQMIDFGRVSAAMAEVVGRELAPALSTLADIWRGAVKPALEAVAPIAAKVGQFLLDHKEILVGLAAAILLIANPWLAVVAVLVVVLAKWDEIKEMFTRTIPEAIDSVLQKVYEIPIIGDIFRDTLNTLQILVETWVAVMINQFTFLFESLQNAFNFFKAVFSGDWAAAWDAVKAQFETTVNALSGIFGIALDAISGIVGSKVEMLKGIGSDIGNAIIDGLTAAINAGLQFINEMIPNDIGLGNVFGQNIGVNLPDNPLGQIGGRSGGNLGPGERNIPRFARGGVVTRPTLAVIGEAGPEAIVPLNGRGGDMGHGHDIIMDGEVVARLTSSRIGANAYMRARS